jgi:hypothetical protein
MVGVVLGLLALTLVALVLLISILLHYQWGLNGSHYARHHNASRNCRRAYKTSDRVVLEMVTRLGCGQRGNTIWNFSTPTSKKFKYLKINGLACHGAALLLCPGLEGRSGNQRFIRFLLHPFGFPVLA